MCRIRSGAMIRHGQVDGFRIDRDRASVQIFVRVSD